MLRGKVPLDARTYLQPHRIKGGDMPLTDAEYWHDVICLSGIVEIVSSRIIPEMEVIRARGRSKGISFPKLINPKTTITGGLKLSEVELKFRPVSTQEYVQFVHSIIKPPDMNRR
jgi:hypothetical protein